MVFSHVSLDGFFTSPSGDFSWAHAGNDDPEFSAFCGECLLAFMASLLKPDFSTATTYMAGCKERNRNSPAALVAVLKAIFFSTSRSVTVASGTEAPWLSNIVPVMDPRVVCATSGSDIAPYSKIKTKGSLQQRGFPPAIPLTGLAATRSAIPENTRVFELRSSDRDFWPGLAIPATTRARIRHVLQTVRFNDMSGRAACQ